MLLVIGFQSHFNNVKMTKLVASCGISSELCCKTSTATHRRILVPRHSTFLICSPREREHKKHISIKLLFYGFSPNKIWNHGALFFYIYLPVIKREAQLWMFSLGSWKRKVCQMIRSCQIQRKIAKVSFATKHGESLFECRVFYLLYWFG